MHNDVYNVHKNRYDSSQLLKVSTIITALKIKHSPGELEHVETICKNVLHNEDVPTLSKLNNLIIPNLDAEDQGSAIPVMLTLYKSDVGLDQSVIDEIKEKLKLEEFVDQQIFSCQSQIVEYNKVIAQIEAFCKELKNSLPTFNINNINEQLITTARQIAFNNFISNELTLDKQMYQIAQNINKSMSDCDSEKRKTSADRQANQENWSLFSAVVDYIYHRDLKGLENLETEFQKLSTARFTLSLTHVDTLVKYSQNINQSLKHTIAVTLGLGRKGNNHEFKINKDTLLYDLSRESGDYHRVLLTTMEQTLTKKLVDTTNRYLADITGNRQLSLDEAVEKIKSINSSVYHGNHLLVDELDLFSIMLNSADLKEKFEKLREYNKNLVETIISAYNLTKKCISLTYCTISRPLMHTNPSAMKIVEQLTDSFINLIMFTDIFFTGLGTTDPAPITQELSNLHSILDKLLIRGAFVITGTASGFKFEDFGVIFNQASETVVEVNNIVRQLYSISNSIKQHQAINYNEISISLNEMTDDDQDDFDFDDLTNVEMTSNSSTETSQDQMGHDEYKSTSKSTSGNKTGGML